MRRFAADNDLLPADGGLLVAVSGGPDSTALLLILAALARRRRLRLAVAYFDHGLRGAAAAETEARFVAGLAQSLGLPLFTGRADVRALAKSERLSLEEAARRARYAFLAGAAREAGLGRVATGHTASDQAETVLLHLIRGSGLSGLAGMAPSAPWPLPGNDDLTLVRPLLRLTRADTVAYCRASGVAPVEDVTNRSPAFRRNRLRHELLPLLHEFNPRVEEALVRLADAARGDLAQLEAAGEAAVGPSDREAVSLSRELLRRWPGSPRRHGLRRALTALLGDRQGFSERHLLALERLVTEGRTGDSLDLPRGVKATLLRTVLELRRGAPMPLALPKEPLDLPVPGEGRFGPLVASASASRPPPGRVSAALDAEAVGRALRLRRRRPGDRFQPLGMAAPKKLQDFLVDAHVPRPQRDSLPLFESERGVVWVGGLRIAEWAKPRRGRPRLYLSYRLVE